MKIRHRQYSDVDYRQFKQGGIIKVIQLVVGVLIWPFIWPLAMLSKISDDIFRSFSELFSLIPFLFGVIIRQEFCRFALKGCGKNVVIDFGTVFIYRNVSIGDNVLIGRYNVIHHCDFGNYVLVAEGCSFLSGSRYHNYSRTDIPMALQGGKKKRIRIGDDCWIGARAVIMEDVAKGAIVAAGSVVTKPIPAYTVVAGNPAKAIKRRGDNQES
jgi:acetyltransferase-like isoleucine patch superfamily enzyme